MRPIDEIESALSLVDESGRWEMRLAFVRIIDVAVLFLARLPHVDILPSARGECR